MTTQIRPVGCRDLWFGQIVSLMGDWFNITAMAILIAKLTNRKRNMIWADR